MIRRKNGFCFKVNPAFTRTADAVLDLLDSLEGRSDIQVVKKNMVRTVYRLEAGGEQVYLKAYHSPGIAEALKSLVRSSRARSEWQAMHRFLKSDLPTAQPILFGERRQAGFLKGAYFAATAVHPAEPFGRFYEQAMADGAWTDALRDKVYDEMARLTAALHQQGVRHGDFHLGNILVSRPERADPSLFVIDLHTVTFPAKLSDKSRILNLARVAEVLCELDEGRDLDRFLERYLAHMPDAHETPAALRRTVMQKVGRLKQRRLKSRTRRCLLKSSEFFPAKKAGFRMNIRRPFTPDSILEAIRQHDSVKEKNDPRLLHPIFKNKVTDISPKEPAGEGRLCVKEYRPRARWRHWFPLFSEARKSWIAGRGLEVRGIDTPATVAWVRGRGRSFLMTRFTPGIRLHPFITRHCKELDPIEQASFQREVAIELSAFVRKLHNSGACHHDLSEQNILVEEGPDGARRYLLIDCDTLLFKNAVSQEMILKNLIQLGHMPENVHVGAKVRFLHLYLDGAGISDRKSMLKEVNRGILERMARKRRKFERLGLPDPHPSPSRMKGSW